jgi:hypothetical protein
LRRIPLAPIEGMSGDRFKSFKSQPAAQSFEREAVSRSNIAEADVGAKVTNQLGLLGAKRRFPNKAGRRVSNEAGDPCEKGGANLPSFVKDPNAAAALPALDNHP